MTCTKQQRSGAVLFRSRNCFESSVPGVNSKKSKVKIQVRCDLTTDLSYSEVGHLLNMLLFNVNCGKQKDYFVRFPGKQGPFLKNVCTVCWSMWSEVPMQS